MQPIFAQDCIVCHGPTRADAGYRMTTLADVMVLVKPGDPTSRLVAITSTGRSMFAYFSGNQQAKADLVRAWVVDNNALPSR